MPGSGIAVVFAQVPLGKDPEGRTAPLCPVLPRHAAYAASPGRGNGLAGEQGDKTWKLAVSRLDGADPEARRDLQLLAAYRQAYGLEKAIKEGMVLFLGRIGGDIGGGLCQLSNLIF